MTEHKEVEPYKTRVTNTTIMPLNTSTPTAEIEPTKLATPDATLLGELMNPHLAKYEREHVAVRHIEHLNQVIEQLRVENEELKYRDGIWATHVTNYEREYEQLKADAELLKAKITEILKGIDKQECDNGWWETSTGADFGKDCLSKVCDAIDQARGKL